MYRIRYRFTKAKWPGQTLIELMEFLDKLTEEAAGEPYAIMLLTSGQKVPVLDINFYVTKGPNIEDIKDVEKHVVTWLKEKDLSPIIFKGAKVFRAANEEEQEDEE